MPAKKIPPEVRFNQRYVIAEDGCWNWTAAKDKDGYGRLQVNATTCIKAHRFSYELYKGSIPNGMLVCHKCDNPSCVNPDHLYIGTNKDNINDMMTRGRYKIQINPNPGERNGRALITEQDVKDIRTKYNNGYKMKYLVDEYNLHRSTLLRIVKGELWSHV